MRGIQQAYEPLNWNSVCVSQIEINPIIRGAVTAENNCGILASLTLTMHWPWPLPNNRTIFGTPLFDVEYPRNDTR